MIRHLNKREKIIFGLTFAVVSLAVVYNGLILPLQEKKEWLDEKIAQQKERLIREREVIQRLKAVHAQYDAYLNHFGRNGTKEEITSSILSEIGGSARKQGLQVMDLKPGEVKGNGLDYQFSVSLTTNSDLRGIIRFLYLLQQKPHFFDVEELEFEKLSRTDESMITTRLVLSKVFIPLDFREERTGSVLTEGR
ncbi:MAG: type II secretion system protein M [Candidatus Omnitrophica bacterium]|nr:type II secretion system protein M [Candidatus Omnitrophota bacterium]